jgi:hypothetical protein
MITHHTRPNERIRFARTAREAFGMPMPRADRPHMGDRFVAIVCAIGAVLLAVLGVLP